jgi:hypothetical protein
MMILLRRLLTKTDNKIDYIKTKTTYNQKSISKEIMIKFCKKS